MFIYYKYFKNFLKIIFFSKKLDTFIKRCIFIRNYNNTTNANFKYNTIINRSGG